MDQVTIVPGEARLHDLRRIAEGMASLSLAGDWRSKVEASAALVDRIVAEKRVAYGITTGFGKLAQTRIPADRVAELQRNLVLSHAAGMGPLLEDGVVRLILALKAASLARGFSGVRPSVVERLLEMLTRDLLPEIPAKGSVGASGDLAPLAHMSAAMIGVGRIRVGGRSMPAADALAGAGLAPLELGPKEGLALLNGTQASTALALCGLFAAERAFAAALVAGALSVEAARGSDVPFDARIHAIRGQKGQIRVAAIMRRLLEGSGIRSSHLDCDKVQDPYSLRCQPQVMGAVLDVLKMAARTLEVEADGVTDNPLVFAGDGEGGGDVLSGGNFHAEPVAFAADMAAMATAEIGSLSERRIALLVDPVMSGLPAFLVEEGGVNSGFMIAQVTAAALASENKTLAHPASVDSLPTSANQEDHVSMATFAARKLNEVADNVAGVVAIELLAAAQGIDFHRPLESSLLLEKAMYEIRSRVPRWDRDRHMAPDLEAAKAIVAEGRLSPLVGEILGGRDE